MKPYALIVVFLVGLPTRASASTSSPCDTLLTIPYGTAEGALDTTRVDGDDPDRNLVAAYQVVESIGDPVIYLLPRREVRRDTLFQFSRGRFEWSLPYEGGFTDFLIDDQQRIVSITLLYRRARDAAEICVQQPGQAVRREPVRRALFPIDLDIGRFMATPTGMQFSRATCPTFLEIDPARAAGEMVVVRNGEGATPAPTRITQEGPFIQRGGVRVLILRGPYPGGVVASFPDGGFVVQRDWRDAGGWKGHVFDTYDEQDPPRLVRTVRTDYRPTRFGTERPCFFTRDHVYVLLLPAEGALLLRY